MRLYGQTHVVIRFIDSNSMKVILTCRECGYQEMGRSDSELMNRIKMLNHIERAHQEQEIAPSRARLYIRQEPASYADEQYRLEASY